MTEEKKDRYQLVFEEFAIKDTLVEGRMLTSAKNVVDELNRKEHTIKTLNEGFNELSVLVSELEKCTHLTIEDIILNYGGNVNEEILRSPERFEPRRPIFLLDYYDKIRFKGEPPLSLEEEYQRKVQGNCSDIDRLKNQLEQRKKELEQKRNRK